MTSTQSVGLRARRQVASNGLGLLTNRTSANPSVVVRALIRAGASREAASEQGLANLTGRMLRQGTRLTGKAALAEELDGMGAGLTVDVGYSIVAASIKCLSADFHRALQILGEVIQSPSFPPPELERLRGQVVTELKEMDDNTRVVAEKAWREMAYPPTHRFHRLAAPTAQTVEEVQIASLERFHNLWYGPRQTTLVIVGDVEDDQALTLAERVFGQWKPAEGAGSPEHDLPETQKPEAGHHAVVMSGKTQSDLVLGTTTFSRHSPDYYALSFANHILGRMYFMGRLGEKVRDEQGLAYYAYSDLSAGYGSGAWTVRAGVNPSNIERAQESIRVEIARFLDSGPTEEEHRDGVASILGGLPRQLETNEGSAAVLSDIELYDLGLDYLERYPEIIRSLTPEQVTEAARTWLQPDHFVTAIAGPPSD